MAADLRYNLADGQLKGSVAGQKVETFAGSGGRAGTKTAGALNWWLANNVFATRVKKSKSNPGGPLPMGTYRLVLHESRKNWIRLLPTHQHMFGRDGFAIHGRGAWGSDGCIVPTDFTIVLQLCGALRHLAKNGQAAPTLEVYAEGQDLERKMNMALNTA